MNKKRRIGAGLVIAGAGLILSPQISSITGFAVSSGLTSAFSWLKFLGIGLIGGGIALFTSGGLEDRVGEPSNALQEHINLESERLLEKWDNAKSKSEKKYISRLLSAALTAPLRKLKYSERIPKEARELPNYGKVMRTAGYQPIGTSKEYVDLQLVHYTTKKNYDLIMKGLEDDNEEDFIKKSPTGWAFFLDSKFKYGTRAGDIRKACGISKPEGAESKEIYFIRIPVRIPASRVWILEEDLEMGKDYVVGKGKRKETERRVKYAIAGGIKKSDIVDINRIENTKFKTEE